jgi:PAS domain S-box-containing protein
MKILIVDDQKENRYFLETLLKASGYEVTVAANGAEALEKLRAGTFNMIISDILMPVMDGFQLCTEVRRDEKLKDIPIVFYTATYTDEKDEELALKLGADKFIRKPVDPDEFIKTIKGVSKAAGKGKIKSKKPPVEEEKENLKLYSERLVKKLEKKMLDLEREVAARKQTEESLRTERDKAHQYLDIAEVMLLALNKKGEITLINRKGNQILGYEEGELLGKNWFTTCLPSPSRKYTKSLFLKLMSGEATMPNFYENPVLTKSGAERIIAWHNTPLKDEEGNTIGTLSSGADITERKGLEEIVKKERQDLKLIIDSSPIIVFYKDREGKFIRVNKTFAEALKVPEDDFVGKTVFDLYSPQIAQGMADDDQEVLQSGRPKLHIIERYESTEGIRWGQTDKVPIFDEHDLLVGLVGFAQDITESRQAEEALRESEERYRSLYENSEDAILLTAPNGRIFHANPAACRMLGRTEAEIIQLGKNGVVDTTDPRLPIALEERNRTGRFRGELTMLRRNGQPFPAEVTSVVFSDEAGQVRTSMIIRDISERKRTEETLIRVSIAVESSSDAIGMSDAQAHHFYHNKAFTELFEYTPEELEAAGGGPAAYADKEVARRVFDTIMSGGTWTGEVKMVSKSGLKFPVLLRADAIKDEFGKIIGLIGVHTDITERKRVEELLLRERETFSTILENAMYGVVLMDKDGKHLYVNPPFTAITGYTLEDIPTGKDWMQKAYPDKEYRQKVREFWQKDSEIKGTTREVGVVCKDGKIKEIEFRRTQLSDGRAVVMLVDVTERKKAEEERYRSYQQMREMLLTTVHALAATVEMKDQYTAGHQPRATQLACAIAAEMELPEEQIEGIRMATSIHDIGKIIVPAEILNKPGPLTEVQYEMVKMHPRAGYDVLKGIDFPWPVAQIVLQHQELMDGSGYPQGLSGKQILLEARILTVANVVEAMTSHRPYRPAHSIKEALEEISRNKGKLYDPVAVDACLKLFTEKHFTFN